MTYSRTLERARIPDGPQLPLFTVSHFPPPPKSPGKNPYEDSNPRPQPKKNPVHHYQLVVRDRDKLGLAHLANMEITNKEIHKINAKLLFLVVFNNENNHLPEPPHGRPNHRTTAAGTVDARTTTVLPSREPPNRRLIEYYRRRRSTEAHEEHCFLGQIEQHFL
ncbi:hypothetical protein LXL04_026569 [Taraxacum kok-saghyz]